MKVRARCQRFRAALKAGRPGIVAALALFVLADPERVWAQGPHLAVIVGLAGDPEHAELFQRWAGTLVDGAGRLGIDRGRIAYLAEKPEQDPGRITGRSTKAEIEGLFTSLSKKAGPDDIVFVMLIGHGTFDGRSAKFNLPGPDMTPQDFAPLLSRLSSKRVVFVNASSSSAPFLEELAGPGRTIITATKTGSERFATLFGGYFVDALMGEAADADKNRRISMLEAFNATRADVARAYEREGIMLTEHPLLDDSGDGKGTGEPTADGPIGRVASIISLGTASAEPLPESPALRALHLERRDLERRVEALKLLKNGMEPARYAAELEKLLTELAVKSRQIRDAEGKK
jgi:hypothetical protein